MKTLSIEGIPKTLLGRPFRIPDLDAEVKDEQMPPIIAEATIQQLLTLLVYNIPRDRLTMKDSIEAGRLIQQVRASVNGSLKIEDEEYVWIKKMTEAYGPSVFGVNAVVIANFLEMDNI